MAFALNAVSGTFLKSCMCILFLFLLCERPNSFTCFRILHIMKMSYLNKKLTDLIVIPFFFPLNFRSSLLARVLEVGRFCCLRQAVRQVGVWVWYTSGLVPVLRMALPLELVPSCSRTVIVTNTERPRWRKWKNAQASKATCKMVLLVSRAVWRITLSARESEIMYKYASEKKLQVCKK